MFENTHKFALLVLLASLHSKMLELFKLINREISLYVQLRIRVDVGLVFGVKINPYLKIKYTFEIFYQHAVKLKCFQFLETNILKI